MNYLQIAGFLDNSLTNGEGLRSVVFVSGCSHKCKGCHNEPMQNFHYGDKVLIQEVLKRIEGNIPIIKGVTFSGGEPFEQAQGLSKLAKYIKGLNVSLWCYTGFTFEEIMNGANGDNGWKDLIYQVDVLVDGRFEENESDSRLKYKGSTNQRIIDVKRTIEEGKMVLWNK